MNSASFRFSEPFTTEAGRSVNGLELFYCTYGNYIKGKSKVVWVCHALTASADCADWWPDLIGDNKAVNPEEFFIICVNIPSSCYGSSGPMSINPETGKKYYGSFPFFTVRDLVRSFIELRKHLDIDEIYLLMGGSMGGYQCMEWAYTEPEVIRQLLLVATSPRESAWGIAIHTAQRLAIEADITFGENRDDAGSKGLKAARAIGMLTYRNYQAFVNTQSDPDDRIENFRSESYIKYQGDKLVNRFNAYSYHLLTRTMDSHNLARERGDMVSVLKQIKPRTLCIGISSDILCPPSELRFVSEHIPAAEYHEIDSPFGHDGFLVEGEKIGTILRKWLNAD